MNTNAETIAEAWLDLTVTALPAAMPEIQRIEMRRAFYAGAAVMLEMVVTTVGRVGDDDQRGIAIMEGWRAEIRQFRALILDGKA